MELEKAKRLVCRGYKILDALAYIYKSLHLQNKIAIISKSVNGRNT